MGRTAFLVAVIAFTSAALAEEKADPPRAEQKYPSGFLSHGDGGDVMEDFFGGRVERTPPQEPGATHKRDPAIRWDGPATGR